MTPSHISQPARSLPIPQRNRLPFAAGSAARLALVVAGLTLLLTLVEAATLSARRPTAHLELGAPEAALVTSGLHAPEQDGERRFRWTAGRSEVRFLNAGLGGAPVLGLRLGAAPAAAPAPDLSVSLNGRPFVTLDIDDRPRQYLLLLPPAATSGGTLAVQLESATAVFPPDTRQVGVRLEAVWLDALAARAVWPAPGVALAQGALLACLAAMLRWLRASWRLAAALLLLAALGLLAAQRYVPAPLLPIYVARLGGAAVALAALTALLLPALERRAEWLAGQAEAAPAIVRALWGATLLACGVRLVGTLYPPFDAYDLTLNLGRFLRTIGGDLVDTNRSFEFRSGVTVYPAGPYLALMPGLLLGLTPKLAVQGGIALVDGLGALATGALALRLGAGARAAVYAALLYAAVPVMLTSLWFGHTAQVFGQGLMAPLALALLAALERDGRRPWLVAAALLSMALLSHIGVTVIAAAWLGLAFLALYPSLAAGARLRLFLTLAAAAAVGLALVYGPAAQLKLAEMGKVGEQIAAGNGLPAYNLIWRAFQISFYEPGWALALPGLVLVYAQLRRRPGAAALLWTWLAAAALFWGIEMATALQARYLVFLAPVACILIGRVLSGLAERGESGRATAWTTVALLLALGCTTWYLGTFQNIQMSMIPLLR